MHIIKLFPGFCNKKSVIEEDSPGVVGLFSSSSPEESSGLVVILSLSSTMIVGSFGTLECM